MQNLANGKIRPNTLNFYAFALASAVMSLKSYAGTREGDRTVIDVLLPFSDDFAHSDDFESAVDVAAERAEATKHLQKFGRAIYVGEASGQKLSDPGAWSFMIFWRVWLID